MSSPIRLQTNLNATAKQIYDALTDGQQFSAMSGGAPAEFTKDAGSTFSAFGGMIYGRTIELVPNQRIVQAWRVKVWPEGTYSLVKFALTGNGADTQLEIEHSSYPEGQGEHLAEGWKTNYVEPLKKFLAK